MLSIVIVSFNARDHLRRCLASLYEHQGGDFEVVIVDNASTDGCAEMAAAEFPQASLIRNQRNLGFAAAANQGARAVKGDVILFLNPDSEIAGDAFSAPSEYLRANPDVGALGLKVLNPDGTLQLSARRFPRLEAALFNRYSLFTRLFPGNRYSRRYLMTGWDHASISDVDWVSGACIMTTRAALDRVGPFDEGFFWGFEDVDYCQRLRRAGLRVVYYPHTSVTHAIGVSARTVPARALIARHKGMWRYYRRYLAANPVLDALVFLGIWARCAAQIAAARLRQLIS
jgi:GT2 family glycosyltransferase